MPNLTSPNHFFRVERTPIGSTSGHGLISTNGRRNPFARSAHLHGSVLLKRNLKISFRAGTASLSWSSGSSDEVTQGVSSASAPLQSDPWGTWIKNHGCTGLIQGGNAQKSSISIGFGAQPPRKIEAPIEDKFQRQV